VLKQEAEEQQEALAEMRTDVAALREQERVRRERLAKYAREENVIVERIRKLSNIEVELSTTMGNVKVIRNDTANARDTSTKLAAELQEQRKASSGMVAMISKAVADLTTLQTQQQSPPPLANQDNHDMTPSKEYNRLL
jgi:hypothetical protein